MRVLLSTRGRFGDVRILERQSDGARLYCIGASVQTMVGADGVSMFGYVHAARLLMDKAERVLIVGGAGGSLATMLARAGRAVTVLDIDPVAETLARAYFDLHPCVLWFTCDVAAFAAVDQPTFDAVCIDACDAQGLIGAFGNAELLETLLHRLCPEGSLIVNLVHKDGAPPWGEALAGALAARGLSATLYRSEEGWEGNELLHIRTRGPADTLRIGRIEDHPPEVRTYLASLRPHTPRAHAGCVEA